MREYIANHFGRWTVTAVALFSLAIVPWYVLLLLLCFLCIVYKEYYEAPVLLACKAIFISSSFSLYLGTIIFAVLLVMSVEYIKTYTIMYRS